MKRVLALLLFFCLLLSLCGCARPLRLYERAIIREVMVSREEGLFSLSFLIDYPEKTLAQQEKKNIERFSGLTITDAVKNAKVSLGRDPFFGSLELIVLNDSLTFRDMSLVISYFCALPALHPSAYVAYSAEPADKILKSEGMTGKIELLSRSLGERDFRLMDAAQILESPSETLLLPNITAGGEEASLSGIELINEHRRVSADESRITGIGFLRGGGKGSAINIEAMGQNSFKILSGKVKIRPLVNSGGEIEFFIDVSAQASLRESYSLNRQPNESELNAMRTALEEEIAQNLNETIDYLVIQSGQDIGNFMKILKKYNSKVFLKYRYDVEGLLTKSSYNISVNCAVERIGGNKTLQDY